MDINPGEIVFSKAGRDKGMPFVVVALLNEQFALIADGGLRKISKPKKKKIKHLKLTGNKAELIADKLLACNEVTNRELKKAIREFLGDANA